MIVLPTLLNCRNQTWQWTLAFCDVVPLKHGNFPSSSFSKGVEKNNSESKLSREVFFASKLSLSGSRCQSGTVLDH